MLRCQSPSLSRTPPRRCLMPSIFPSTSTKHLMHPQNSIPHSGWLRDRTLTTPLSIRFIMQNVHPLEKKALFKNYTQIMRNSIPVCAASPHVLAELYCWTCPVDNPTCGFAKEKSVSLSLKRFSLTCFVPITNSKRFRALFLSTYWLLYTEKMSEP